MGTAQSAGSLTSKCDAHADSPAPVALAEEVENGEAVACSALIRLSRHGKLASGIRSAKTGLLLRDAYRTWF